MFTCLLILSTDQQDNPESSSSDLQLPTSDGRGPHHC